MHPLERERSLPLIPTLARISNPFAWRSPGRNVVRLEAFASAELNTLVELEQAANQTPSAARAAAYLVHASDEARHARMFHAHARRVAASNDLAAPPAPRTDTARLFHTLGEVDFLAFVHRGEGRGRRQFEAHRDHFFARDPRGAGLFTAILEDEKRHESYSVALLESLHGSPRSRIRAMAVWEAWTTLRRMQRATASMLFGGCVYAMTPLFAILCLWTRWVRPERQGWH